MSTRSKTTSFDVAEAAGVSQSTVSRALRGKRGISAETRARIASAASHLHYVPDRRAANLRSGVTGNIAVAILTTPGQPLTAINPLYLTLLGLVEAAAAAHGYRLLISFEGSTPRPTTEFEQTREADGVIVIGSAANRRAWQCFGEAGRAGSRIVAWGCPDDSVPTVRCDNRAGAVLATEHLIDAGRCSIAFVGPGWQTHVAFRDRRAGYLHALTTRGLTPVETSSTLAHAREEQGYQAVLSLIEQGAGFDAIFAACDLLAIGAMRALHERGRRIPLDVSVVGFDGILSAGHVFPGLTTVEQDVTVAGERLMAALMGQIAGNPTPIARVPVHLVTRGSSKVG